MIYPAAMATAVEARGVGAVLERALGGERITDEDAGVLLRSRDLMRIGKVAHELRNRKNAPDRVTFVIDRNLNYSNVCYTDCNFCAFYRKPGDTREGYTLPKPVIFKKIEETLALGGTALLMQGGHNPDLGSTGTRICSARSRPATRSTCTRCRPARCSTSPARSG